MQFFSDDVPAQFDVQVFARDSFGETATSTATIVVSNGAPSAKLVHTPTVDEGQLVTFSFVDVYAPTPADEVLLAFGLQVDLNHNGSFADPGETIVATPGNPSRFQLAFPDNGNYSVQGRVVDPQGASHTLNSMIEVVNANPNGQMALTVGGVIDEGSSFGVQFVNLTDAIDDMSAGLSVEFDVDGDGLFGDDANAVQFEANGTYVLRGRVIDKDGGVFEDSLTMVIQNVAPTIDSFVTSASVSEGGLLSLTGAFSDPGSTDPWLATARVAAAGSSTGLTIPVEIDPATKTFTSSFLVKQEVVGGYDVTLLLSDGVAIVQSSTQNVSTINDVPEVAHSIGDLTIPRGVAIRTGYASLREVFTDVDNPHSELTYSVESVSDPGIVSGIEISEDGLLDLTFASDQSGTAVIRLRATDPAGSFVEDEFAVHILAPTFRVTQVMPSVSGITVSVNHQLDVARLDLYDGLDASVDLPDLVLVGANSGPIQGSAVWNSKERKLTFLPTDGPFEPDAYTLTLFGRADGWVDTAGQQLDGDEDEVAGGAFIHEFVVASPAPGTRLVSLPDVIRGPGQMVDLTPADDTDDPFTLRVDDATGITHLELELRYDSSLLALSTAAKAAGIPADWQVAMVEVEPGVVRIDAHGTTALTGSNVSVVTFVAAVPSGATYGAAQLLQVQNLSINGGTIPGIGDTSLQQAIYLGDVSGNAGYSAYDAGLLSRVGQGIDSGFDAFPLIDPQLLGDASGDGITTTLDARFVAEKSVGLIRPELADVPAGVVPTFQDGASTTVSVTSGLYSGSPGDHVEVQMIIGDAASLLGANLELEFDRAVLELTDQDVSIPDSVGEFLRDWEFAVNVDEVFGKAQLAIYHSVPHASSGGTLANLNFETADGATAGTYPLALTGNLNEGAMALVARDGDIAVQPAPLEVQLPSGSGANHVVIRRVGDDVEVFDLVNLISLARNPLASTHAVRILGSNSEIDRVLVDYDSGGFFQLAGGIDVRGGSGDGDVLTVTGTGNTQAIYSTVMFPTGQTLLSLSEASQEHQVLYSGFDDLTFDGMQSFSSQSSLIIGDNSLTIGSATPVDLGALTVIDGGTLSSSSPLILGPAESLIAAGVINGRFTGHLGSVLRLIGDLSVGDAASVAGFITDGDVEVGNHRLTLHDHNQAVLGSLTTLGEASVAGTIYAANGLLVDFGNNITGWGTLQSPNDPNKLVMHNGSISGNSLAEQISLSGFVKGVGTLHNVNIAGTYSPGFSPAVVYNGSVDYGPAGTTLIEVGGTTPGDNGYDQINHSGDVVLDGTLDVQVAPGFVPSYGDVFDVLTWTGTRTGTFSGFVGTRISTSLAVIPRYTNGALELVATGPGDANLDGRVSIADFSVLQNGYGQLGHWQQGDFNLDGKISIADFAILQNAYGTTYFTAGSSIAGSSIAGGEGEGASQDHPPSENAPQGVHSTAPDPQGVDHFCGELGLHAESFKPTENEPLKPPNSR